MQSEPAQATTNMHGQAPSSRTNLILFILPLHCSCECPIADTLASVYAQCMRHSSLRCMACIHKCMHAGKQDDDGVGMCREDTACVWLGSNRAPCAGASKVLASYAETVQITVPNGHGVAIRVMAYSSKQICCQSVYCSGHC